MELMEVTEKERLSREDAAVRLHADVRGLEAAGAGAKRGGEARRRDARGFHIGRHADAAG